MFGKSAGALVLLVHVTIASTDQACTHTMHDCAHFLMLA